MVAAGLFASAANAQTSPRAQSQDELIEKVVVRNRLYTTAGKLEVAPTFGFTILNRLTDHYNFNLGVAYNVSESIAFEARGGYAYSRHTGLADRIAENLLRRDPSRELGTVDGLSELWEMQGNGVLGLRWNPIYGKINLVADLPVHFQSYIWVGGGVGTFQREAIVECLDVGSRAEGICNQFATENRVGPMASVALGFRFFTHQGGALRLEVRDYAFQDDYRVGIDRRAAEAGQNTGSPVGNPGFINLVLFDLGYVFLF